MVSKEKVDSAGARQLFGPQGFVVPRTSGRSMRPLLWGQSHRVAVVPLDGEPAVGDILFFAYRRPDGNTTNIVHRLVAINGHGAERRYITRGDNCLGSETVSRADIIGRVAEVHRLSGFRPWHAVWARRFTVADRRYRLYTRLWMALWPLRRLWYILRLRRG